MTNQLPMQPLVLDMCSLLPVNSPELITLSAIKLQKVKHWHIIERIWSQSYVGHHLGAVYPTYPTWT